MDLEPVRARLERRFGPGVHPWVDRLPERVAELAARWELTVGEPYPQGNSSVAFRCGDAVLKLSPEAGFLAEQARVLQMFASSGRAPQIRAHEDGAMLMAAIEPGTYVTEAPSPEEFAELLCDLHSVGDPAVAQRDLAGYTEEIFVRAEKRGVDIGDPRPLRDELVASQPEVVLLHGDLHFDNILEGSRLMVVDPKACAGERAFDAVDYAIAAPSRVATLARAADLDLERLRAWRQVFSWVGSPL